MFKHKHPYPPFIPEKATHLIVGTLPPFRFSEGKLDPGDVDFCYGSRFGYLWPVFGSISGTTFLFESSDEAVEQRKDFLQAHGIGICDIVASCERDRRDASDSGMKNIVFRDVLKIIAPFKNLRTLLFMGSTPERLFLAYLKTKNIHRHPVSGEVSSYRFEYHNREFKTFRLVSPSGAANRAIGSTLLYKVMKKNDPGYTVIDFRKKQYAAYFPVKENSLSLNK